MSLEEIFDPMVRAYFAGKCSSNGDGSGGGSNSGVFGAVYHAGRTYPEFDGKYKISDLTPTVEELTSGYAFEVGGGAPVPLIAEDMEGLMVFIYGGNTELGLVITKNGAAEFGDASVSGFYLSAGADSDIWFVWEPA